MPEVRSLAAVRAATTLWPRSRPTPLRASTSCSIASAAPRVSHARCRRSSCRRSSRAEAPPPRAAHRNVELGQSFRQALLVPCERDSWIDVARIGFDAFLVEFEQGFGDRLHMHTFEYLTQLCRAFAATTVAVAHDHCRLALPFFVEMVDRVLEHRWIAPVVLRRHEHEGAGF